MFGVRTADRHGRAHTGRDTENDRADRGRIVKVLVVEDDLAIRLLIVATLPDDWCVIQAADGLEALVLAREHEPEAIILDHQLPILHGAEVCRVLRREAWATQVRVVGLTASSDPAVRRAFADAGADAFLTKPFSPVQLLDLLDKLAPRTCLTPGPAGSRRRERTTPTRCGPSSWPTPAICASRCVAAVRRATTSPGRTSRPWPLWQQRSTCATR